MSNNESVLKIQTLTYKTIIVRYKTNSTSVNKILNDIKSQYRVEEKDNKMLFLKYKGKELIGYLKPIEQGVQRVDSAEIAFHIEEKEESDEEDGDDQEEKEKEPEAPKVPKPHRGTREGINMELSELSWKELRSRAKDAGITVGKKKRKNLHGELVRYMFKIGT
jgi:hypothetical protein